MTTRHQLINPPHMSPAPGFAHVVVPADGRTIYLAGQIAADPTGAVVGDTFAEQYDLALKNVVDALAAGGGVPEDIVSLVVFTTSMDAYRDDLRGVGRAHREHLGRHYPAMAMLGVTELFERDAMVEIIATAVVAA
ncbi:MAG: RidA family protein [Actinomycetota bacterium]|jgi:enamine deaminase RidA (YjgF/YER057c/UK114 family)|nr:RidA family protein [Actinomycetota bacterium]